MVTNKQSFEVNMQELEKIVTQLEQGQIPLQHAIDQYKRGMDLSKALHDQLESAQKTLTQVIDEDGNETEFKRADLPQSKKEEDDE